jgi:hypothetical protein
MPLPRHSAKTGVRAMYTGTLIDELMKAVERAEKRALDTEPSTEWQHWYATQEPTLCGEAGFLGVR